MNIPGTQTVDFVGTLNNGPISPQQPRARAAGRRGLAAAGQSYPSPLDWNAVTTTGLDAAVYVFRSTGPYAGTYSTYVPGGPSVNGGTNQLAAMQAFSCAPPRPARPAASTSPMRRA